MKPARVVSGAFRYRKEQIPMDRIDFIVEHKICLTRRGGK
ncbi:hypothetical protein GCWU000342_01579 [Shuttleworthella satelles DSM 14600]|uniref:Uncharacterized protein n=1 Tax=Shuttleworthella satelles DSM 14600 TaxID=626523 RepID=C4GC91_9FIRM|nr:hypothetical protein GCWU000342_01579 [Shuttleworthia satelles DSM 14600]